MLCTYECTAATAAAAAAAVSSSSSFFSGGGDTERGRGERRRCTERDGESSPQREGSERERKKG